MLNKHISLFFVVPSASCDYYVPTNIKMQAAVSNTEVSNTEHSAAPCEAVTASQTTAHTATTPDAPNDDLKMFQYIVRRDSVYGIVPIQSLQSIELVPKHNGIGDRAGRKAKGKIAYRLVYSNRTQSKKLYNKSVLPAGFSVDNVRANGKCFLKRKPDGDVRIRARALKAFFKTHPHLVDDSKRKIVGLCLYYPL